MANKKLRYPKRKAAKVVLQIRHTHRTAAAIEDLIAVALDIAREAEQSRLYTEDRTRRLLAILRETRNGPHAYNPDQAAGVRIKVISR